MEMLNCLKNEANMTYTENGAVTNKTTGSDCLDLFYCIGAMRWAAENEIVDRFIRAYTEDPDLAMKILFYARDIRGGLGERRAFRTILKYLADNSVDSVIKNIENIAEYGRFDDLLSLVGTSCEEVALSYIKVQLMKDLEDMKNGKPVSLLAKWLPSINASNRQTVKNALIISNYCEMDKAAYRKNLVNLRAYIKIIENNLRTKDYSFDYCNQPSKALYKYRAAFMRNDAGRYMEFISRVNSGEIKLNASTLMPYELIDPLLGDGYGGSFLNELTPEEKNVLNATWSSLDEYSCDGDALAVIDTSGSMYWGVKPKPASVALSLGLYFAEHNKGRFANHFIEFSARPQLIEVKGDTFADKLRYVCTFNKVANTNIEAVFDLVLNAAVENNLPKKEMPKRLIIISDMEFDCCVENSNKTVFYNAKKKYEEKGYPLPKIVFWNVASRHDNMPVRMNEQGTMLVSGCTPRLFSMIMEDTADPYQLMLEVLTSERYERIAA